MRHERRLQVDRARRSIVVEFITREASMMKPVSVIAAVQLRVEQTWEPHAAPARDCDDPPGTHGKLQAMAERVAAGVELYSDDDRDDCEGIHLFEWLANPAFDPTHVYQRRRKP